MKPRFDHTTPLQNSIAHLLRIEDELATSGLDPSLIKLVKLRVSQINGCGYCLHMHTREALAAGETVERLGVVAAFRESPLFTTPERVALEWAEALTSLGPPSVLDRGFEALRVHFDESQVARLTLVVGMINLWNRLAVGSHAVHSMVGQPAPE